MQIKWMGGKKDLSELKTEEEEPATINIIQLCITTQLMCNSISCIPLQGD